MNSALPQVNYSTLLDYYIWLCFGFIFLVATENVAFPTFLYLYCKNKKHNVPNFDIEECIKSISESERYYAFAFGMIFILINVAWGLKISLWRRERTRLSKKYLDDETILRKLHHDGYTSRSKLRKAVNKISVATEFARNIQKQI